MRALVSFAIIDRGEARPYCFEFAALTAQGRSSGSPDGEASGIVKAILRFLKSVKLAIALITVLALGSALATILPQGLPEEGYAELYGGALGALVFRSGMSSYFRSLPFIVPAFLFFANLSTCAADRFVRELRKESRRRHGPDLLHLGLMLLVVGALLSFAGRREGSVSLAEGESARLPDGRILRLERFEYLAYGDGRPKEWTSVVSILREEELEVEAYPLRVNHPLRLGSATLYQASREAGAVERSGILAVADPGYRLVLAALLVTGAGLFLTFFQKLGDQKP